MGVSVHAYKGAQFERDADGSGGVDNDVIEVFLDPSASRLRADDLDKGVYSFLGKLEEPIGSYGYFDEFRKALAQLANASFPPESGEWREVPFGELLFATDAHVLMGPAMVEAFQKNLKSFAEEAFKKLSTEHHETYRALEKAADHALQDTQDEGGGYGVLYIH